jgi:hypothetical protein
MNPCGVFPAALFKEERGFRGVAANAKSNGWTYSSFVAQALAARPEATAHVST